LIRHVPDEHPPGKRRDLDECRGRNDVVTTCQLRLLIKIDDFEFYASRQNFIAELTQSLDGGKGILVVSGYIQAKPITAGRLEQAVEIFGAPDLT
jgi:hypothetical protein